MNPKALRFFTLVPALLSLTSLFRPLFPPHSFMQQFLMSPAMAFGMLLVCATWFIYLSGYRYGKQVLLVEGVISLLVISWVLAAHLLNVDLSVQRLVAPPRSPFLLNLAFMFMAGYLIQIFYYWLPRTKLLVNVGLAIIFSMALLSLFGHL